ncbi:MAG: tetratricopeptide repeat protein [Bilophila wadsworthia]
MQSFNARNYKQALKSFSDFTDTYGKHKLVSNAWFWRGECNYQLRNFPAAALDYEQVISNMAPAEGPSAYLKQGMCFIKAGKKDAAKVRLQELIKKFPKSPEATRARSS